MVPHIDRLEFMWDTKYDYAVGFDVQYSSGYQHRVLNEDVYTSLPVVYADIDIAEDDYINNFYGRKGDIWDKLVAMTWVH